MYIHMPCSTSCLYIVYIHVCMHSEVDMCLLCVCIDVHCTCVIIGHNTRLDYHTSSFALFISPSTPPLLSPSPLSPLPSPSLPPPLTQGRKVVDGVRRGCRGQRMIIWWWSTTLKWMSLREVHIPLFSAGLLHDTYTYMYSTVRST